MSSGPEEQPSHVITSSWQRSESGPSHGAPRPNPSSVDPSQLSSAPLQISGAGSTAPVHGPKTPPEQVRVPGIQAPTSDPQGTVSPSVQGAAPASPPVPPEPA